MRTYWVITVKDPGDRDAGVSGYERRFEFGDLEEALRCANDANGAGFKVATAKVGCYRSRVVARASRS